MLGFAPVAALPVAALDFAAATVLPARGPLRIVGTVVAAGAAGRPVAAGVRGSAVVTPGAAGRVAGAGVTGGAVVAADAEGV